MLGKGDSDFILGKKKKKEKKNKTKKKTASHLSKKTLIDKTLEHTLRQLKKSSGDGGLIVYLHRGIEN